MKIIRSIHVFSPHDMGVNDILICRNRIEEISPHISIKYKELEEIDGTGLMAFPGLIDQHVHILGGGGEKGFDSRIPEIGADALYKSGITTAVGLLGTDTSTRTVKSLLAKTKELRLKGLSAYCLTGGYAYPSPTFTGDIHDDIAYIDEILGLKLAMADHRSSYPTEEELIKAASAVRKAGLLSGKKSYLHIHMGDDENPLKTINSLLRNTSLPITLFHPTHCARMMNDAIDFGRKGGYIDFTASENPERTADELAEISGAVEDRSLITLSTDANGSLPLWNSEGELVSFKAASPRSLFDSIGYLITSGRMTVPEALSFATSHAAGAIGLYPQKGTLRPGSDGDILLVDSNYTIRSVIAGGIFLLRN